MKRKQTFLGSCTITHLCIEPSKIGETYARYTVCTFDLSIKRGGYDVVSKHVKSVRLKAKEGCVKHTSMLSSFLQLTSSGTDLSMIRAEILFAQFSVEHKIPILSEKGHISNKFPSKTKSGSLALGRFCFSL